MLPLIDCLAAPWQCSHVSLQVRQGIKGSCILTLVVQYLTIQYDTTSYMDVSYTDASYTDASYTDAPYTDASYI